ncbi:MAG: SUMF1/EgtB/PvdO family nonheme iron enzyme [Candidatus Marinimicrobia bacterium]|nr:SUMF1/EgtB/PvdO family nonheme iron enzyme [Candidatus Neomarinimicrobiota bacterium]
MRSLIILIVISVSLFSCKTITLDDEQVIADIPEGLELVKIPAGAYSAGETAKIKFLDYDYLIMKYPVTNLQYIEYLKEASKNGDIIITSQCVTGYYKGDKNWPASINEFVDFDDPDSRIGFNPPDEFVIKWNWFGGRKEGYDNHPVTEVTWFGATAFAEYYGMRLPTKEEWEKAARANSKNDYPWGNTLSPSYANYKDSGDEYDNGTTPVGYYNGLGNTNNSYSPYGIYDMAGNVWEWTSSWWRDSSGKVIKGGSWNSLKRSGIDTDEIYVYDLLIWFELFIGYLPTNSSREIGFRCIKDIEK